MEGKYLYLYEYSPTPLVTGRLLRDGVVSALVNFKIFPFSS